MRRFPSDEVTGMPLPIMTLDIAKELAAKREDSHHHSYFERTNPDLEGRFELRGPKSIVRAPEQLPLEILAGIAVRVSRTQRLTTRRHRELHDRYPFGPELPHSLSEKFAAAVKGCAGVVSRLAVDVTRPEGDEIVYMNDTVFSEVTRSRHLHTEYHAYNRPYGYQQRVLGSFYLKYALQQEIDVSDRMKKDFSRAGTDEATKVRLGGFIMAEAMHASLAPLMPEYAELRRQGMVQENVMGIWTAVWANIPERTVTTLMPMFTEKLAAEAA